MDEKSVWKKEISFRRKPKAPKAAASEAAATSAWKKEVSFKRKQKPRQAQPLVAEAETMEVAPPMVEPVETVVPVVPVVHPPVPAADLPPLPTERDEKPTPFWRREVVLGRRGDPKAKDEPKEDTPKAEKPKKQKAPKAPKE